MTALRVAGAQINPVVGDIDGNVELAVSAIRWAEAEGADVLLLPELVVSGYPPEDLVLRKSFIEDNRRAVEHLATVSGRTAVVVGFIDPVDPEPVLEDAVPRCAANAAAVLAGGEIKGVYHKVLLPNYGVFDEARYFIPGDRPGTVWEVAGVPVGVSVCEDIWSPGGPPTLQARAGARILLNINGSPYHAGRAGERAELIAAAARRSRVPVVYLNMVGGQDDLVFDGDSMVFGAGGELEYRAAQFVDERFLVDVDVDGGPPVTGTVPVSAPPGAERVPLQRRAVAPRLGPEAEVYRALVTGLGDYVRKNGFTDVLVGCSGGIDSALTATIATDALGPASVWAVTMPSRYSSEGSWKDSQELATRLGCRFDVVPVDDVFAGYLDTLAPLFAGTAPGLAEENLQARIRGATLMGLSNKFGAMVVATGNKSEMAVGYATLYGDMVGGYAVLKDVLKTEVYRLAEWRNRDGEPIPRAIIDKAPSAELRPDQKDTDSLPEYAALDHVLVRYVEQDMAPEAIVAEGMDPELVEMVTRMVDRSEYKRRQAAPGVRISTKAFGKDRRLPITNGYGRSR